MAWIEAMKLVALPLTVLAFRAVGHSAPVPMFAAVNRAAVPTAKTAYVIAEECHVEEPIVGATIFLTAHGSVVTPPVWLCLLG